MERVSPHLFVATDGSHIRVGGPPPGLPVAPPRVEPPRPDADADFDAALPGMPEMMRSQWIVGSAYVQHHGDEAARTLLQELERENAELRERVRSAASGERRHLRRAASLAIVAALFLLAWGYAGHVLVHAGDVDVLIVNGQIISPAPNSTASR